MKKRIAYLLLFILVSFCVYHHESLIYGIQQGSGQVEVLWNAQEIEELIQDENFPDSTKEKFEYISEVKAFAEKELGLTQTENYTTFYDQKGEPILWVVTASPEFKIEAYEWTFPIAGGFPYKGFWDIEKAKKEAEKMKTLDYDTEVDEVNAWSTLGWFKDPVLSSMLNHGPGRLAELIIHESTHATLYVKDSVEFNENLASFVGKIGAELFLKHHFGDSSAEYIEYIRSNKRKTIYKDYMRTEIDVLNEKYESLDSSLSIDVRRARKQEWINEMKEGIFKLDYQRDSLELRTRLDSFAFNNAYFSGFSTYSEDLPNLKIQLKKEFNGNLKLMILRFKEKYESL